MKHHHQQEGDDRDNGDEGRLILTVARSSSDSSAPSVRSVLTNAPTRTMITARRTAVTLPADCVAWAVDWVAAAGKSLSR